MKRNTPKEVFLHLLSMATLYMSAVNFLQLIWQGINKWIPDSLAISVYGPSFSVDTVRFALSSIIIVFPVYMITVWLLNRGYQEAEESREFKLRKWLVYLTLFIASLILIGDLIAIVRTFLEGELTLRFMLKALSVFVVAGSVFGYYLWDIRFADQAETPKNQKILGIGVSVAVLVAVVIGFFVMGSPKTERLHRIDAQRVNDLQMIQSQTVYFWQAKQKLPSSIAELRNDINGFIPPNDPETKLSYEYSVKGDMSFVLCATFALPSAPETNNKYYPVAYPEKGIMNGGVWDHTAGRVCFERTIDKAFFPPINLKQ